MTTLIIAVVLGHLVTLTAILWTLWDIKSELQELNWKRRE